MSDKHLDAFLAIVIVMGFFGIVGVLLFHEVPEESKDILGPLIGVIGAAVGTIVGYRWGSSSGSAAKDSSRTELLHKMAGTGDGAGTVNTKEKTVTEKVTTVDKTTTTPDVPAEQNQSKEKET